MSARCKDIGLHVIQSIFSNDDQGDAGAADVDSDYEASISLSSDPSEIRRRVEKVEHAIIYRM